MSSVHCPDADRLEPYYFEAEKLAGGPGHKGNRTLVEIMEEIQSNDVLLASSHGNDAIDRTKNVMVNARDEMVKYAAQYSISTSQLDERADEMIDTGSKSSNFHEKATISIQPTDSI